MKPVSRPMRPKVTSKIKKRAIVFFLLTHCVLFAQEYSFRSFGNLEGLSNLAIRNIYQDHVGFLWVSTENGIFRYDGERFEAFGVEQGIPVNSSVAFGDAPDGTLLVGGPIGLYHLRGNHFEKIAGDFKSVSNPRGIASDGLGHTYLGTDSGLKELYSQPGQGAFSIRRIPKIPGASNASAGGVFLDGDKIWYGCGFQLCRMGPDGNRIFGAESGLDAQTTLSVILKDREGTVWIFIRHVGLWAMRSKQEKFQRPVLPISASETVSVPVLDSDGRILLTTPNGLFLADKQGWLRVDSSSGLRGAVNAAYEDRQHSLWIGLVGRGLVQWRGYGEWENYSSISGLPSDMVWEIQPQANGTVWVGTEGGLLRGERQKLGMKWEKVPGLDGFPIHSLRLASDGDLWLGSESRGVARLHLKTGKVEWFGVKQGLTGTEPYTLRFDHQQRLWAATEAGLFVANAPYTKFSQVNELPSKRFFSIAEGRDGTIWTGGPEGLFSLADGRWKNFHRADGLSSNAVLALGADPDGAIWVGYQFGGGIDRVHLRAGALNVEKNVQRQGSSGLIYFLDFDAAGRLWAGTEHGVDVWNGSRWSHFDTGDGLTWNDCDLNGFAAEPDGTVWIGTAGGLSRFKPLPRLVSPLPIEVVFTRLVMGKTDVSEQSDPSLRMHGNSLIAGYTALNASRANGVLFRYRLEGTNSGWTETTRHELQFAQLAPGDYRLRVEAQDEDGVWSEHAAEFAFKVPTPWYGTWWFFTGLALLPVLVLGGFVRSRWSRLEKEKKEFNLLKEAHDEIKNLAFYDHLTALPNRRMLLDRLNQALVACAQNRRLRALLFIDLNNFKVLNDTLGHQTGDLLLQEAARRLTSSIREADTVARWGGDEFVVILGELSEDAEKSANLAETVAEKMLAILSEPYLLAGRECRSGGSIGIAIFGKRNETADEVLQQADIAMYQAKNSGRNTARFFAPALQAAVNARAAMEADLHLAIQSDQFLLYYQPQVENGRVIGAEALLRWNHPQRGIILPGDFIPLAEETGLILPLGDLVLEAACKQSKVWRETHQSTPCSIAVNISARQFHQPNFVQSVLATLHRTGANARDIELELTESMLVANVEDIIAKMTELRSYGLRFSMDDFGTGYSSLSYLKRLPLDQLKIDRAFVQDILLDAKSGAIMQTIISLAVAMDVRVIAEGVETEEQRLLLARLGCHAFQGYLFSRPLPVNEFESLLSAAKDVTLQREVFYESAQN